MTPITFYIPSLFLQSGRVMNMDEADVAKTRFGTFYKIIIQSTKLLGADNYSNSRQDSMVQRTRIIFAMTV